MAEKARRRNPPPPPPRPKGPGPRKTRSRARVDLDDKEAVKAALVAAERADAEARALAHLDARDRMVWDLKRAGASYRMIEDALQLTHDEVMTSMQRLMALLRVSAEEVEQWRVTELARSEELTLHLFTQLKARPHMSTQDSAALVGAFVKLGAYKLKLVPGLAVPVQKDDLTVSRDMLAKKLLAIVERPAPPVAIDAASTPKEDHSPKS